MKNNIIYLLEVVMKSLLYSNKTVTIPNKAYHRRGKICWAKHSWFQPYEDFCQGALATSVHYLPIVTNSWENFHGKVKNCENHESLAQRIFSPLWYTMLIHFINTL